MIYEFPLIDEIDHEILMHKDAHFGGSFQMMIDYYKNGGKGVHPDFELKRIKELAAIEKEVGGHLSEKVLFEDEKAAVHRAKKHYLALRELYEKELRSDIPRLIADLVLSEEEEPRAEMDALIGKGGQVVKPLLDLLTSDDFYDPLSPGYGMAPAAAAQCLGNLGDESAIAPLFAAMGKEDFFTEESIVEALRLIGGHAKLYLLKKMQGRPITRDNEHAAIALLAFREDAEVAKACLFLLQEDETLSNPFFAAYLALGCASLPPSERETFKQLADDPKLSLNLRQEMKELIKSWS